MNSSSANDHRPKNITTPSENRITAAAAAAPNEKWRNDKDWRHQDVATPLPWRRHE